VEKLASFYMERCACFVSKCFLKKIVILLIALGGLLVTGCAVLTNGLSGSLYIESSKVQQIIDKAEYPAKRMQELKDDPVGAPLVKSYEMFAALMEQKNMDSSLVDSMRLSRRAFFEPWKRVSDSICNSASGELSLEIRAVYEAAFRFGIESDYDYLLKEQDSLHYEERKDVSFEDKVEFLKSSGLGEMMAHFFVVRQDVPYFVKPAKTLNELESLVSSPWEEREKYKVTNMACMEKNPLGQETLVLTKEYSTLLDAFMGVDPKYAFPFSDSNLKEDFLMVAISVVSRHWGHGFHYESFPAIMSVVFNENRTLAILNVMGSFNTGGFYSLEKRDGVWKAVAHKNTWIM
jgi:hypothetical protein